MRTQFRHLVLGLLGFTLASFGIGYAIDQSCEGGCVQTAYAAHRGAFHITFSDEDPSGAGDGNVEISLDGKGVKDDRDNPARLQNPKTLKYPVKDLQKIAIKTYVTNWQVIKGTSDQVEITLKGYLSEAEWTIKDDTKTLAIDMGKTGPSEAVLSLPPGFAGRMILANTHGEITIQDLAEVTSLNLLNVSGEVSLKSAPKNKLSINTVSGDITWEPSLLSKDLTVNYESVSGDFTSQIKQSIKELSLQTVSGDIELQLSKSVGFKYDLEGISADFSGLPDESTIENGFGHNSAEGAFGPEPRGTLNFESVSGDLSITMN